MERLGGPGLSAFDRAPLLRWASAAWILATAASGFAAAADPPEATPVYDYEVVAAYPHDYAAFTQGLAWAAGTLYEGTGLWGSSSVRRVELETGVVRRIESLPRREFGEGIALIGDRLYQLTWKAGIAYERDRESLASVRRRVFQPPGWGLTYDGVHLVLSDGTPTLRFLSPETFQVVRRLVVRDERGPVELLNELEFVEGEIFANVWRGDTIVRIDPKTGRVLGRIDLTGLHPEEARGNAEDFPNGIAYDPTAKRLFVTGKRWPRLFEIRLRRRGAGRPADDNGGAPSSPTPIER